MKIVTVVGARPQFIKAAAVSRAVKKITNVEEIIVHTGQHYDINMSDIFFEEMNIPKPNYNLSVNGGSHGSMTGQMLEKIEEVLLKEKPDWLLVYGDTNSTLAGALAASKLHIKVAHVEAGLRSFNMRMPEEQNRILTDRISTVLFCPTDQAMENLQNEGYANIDVDMLNVGDVMLDAATFYADNLKEDSQLPADYNQGNFILATCHRAENTDSKERLESIVSSLNKLSETFNVYLPLHPRTKKKMEEFGLSFSFQTLDPIGYFDMIRLLKDCSFVMTDSGGLQKEAYFFEKACLTMRDETEWVELVNNGVNKLVGADKDLILSSASEIQSGKLNFKEGLYGDKKASEKIIQYLLDH